MPLTAAALVFAVVAGFFDLPGLLPLLAVLSVAVALALYVRVGTPGGPAVPVRAPVRGRWRVLNSPGSQVPSHRIHAWSQTYAVDLVADPADGSRPGMAWRPLARRPTEFPAFGQAVLAPLDGEVVRAHGWMRDHRSRTSPLGLVYFMLESVRELAGPVGVLGNHLVIRGDGDTTFVLLAHLQRRSLLVGQGDRVQAGQTVARCGNSGNTTEPHLHIQAMDRPGVWNAAGRPLSIDGALPPPDGEILPTAARDDELTPGG